MNVLRQATASQSRSIGPFVDDTDFKTPKTGLTIANTDVKLLVNGGASANKNSGGGTHRANGHYGFTFDATDTATAGEMEVSIVVATALPVFKTFYVMPAEQYDILYGGTPAGPYPLQGILESGTAQSAGANTLVMRAGASSADNNFNNATIWAFGSTQGYWQTAVCTTSTDSSPADTLNHGGWSGGVTPSGTITYRVFGVGSGGTPPVVDLRYILGTLLTETSGGRLANRFTGLFDVTSNGFTAATAVSTYAGGAVASVTGNVGGNVGGNVVGSVGSVSGNVGGNLLGTLAAAERNAIADALLARNIAGGSSGGRIVSEALYMLRNRTNYVAGTLTVYMNDDTTPSWTAAITQTAGNPITQIDPA